jgi:hypothetical protein
VLDSCGTLRFAQCLRLSSLRRCPFKGAGHKDWVSLPSLFRGHGYRTAGFGKIYHPNICDGAAVGEETKAWTEPYYHAPCISLGSLYDGGCYENFPFAPKVNKDGKTTSIYSNDTNATTQVSRLLNKLVSIHRMFTLIGRLYKLTSPCRTDLWLPLCALVTITRSWSRKTCQTQ